MIKTWRWFGNDDPIRLELLRQVGIEGIVSALHNFPAGKVWDWESIIHYKTNIEDHGLKWLVVESLPVSEAIKYGGEERDFLIQNYIESLENLGKAGIKTVCYNFMPVLDWVRTDLHYPLADGSFSLFFDKIRFAYFDICILKRDGAKNDYSPEERLKVEELHSTITEQETGELIYTIIVKTQGFVNGNIREGEPEPVERFKELLSLYKDTDRSKLRQNLKYFLERIIPVCQQYDIQMCIHPDDPPFQLLGLPRIVTNQEDISWILNAVNISNNGLTFCAGSLSASLENDLPLLAEKFAPRTKFVHLRSTFVFPNGDFVEASHLEGRGALIKVIRILEKYNPGLPMRIDHGKLMTPDLTGNYNPGYSFLGRMLALGQIEGVIATIKNDINQ